MTIDSTPAGQPAQPRRRRPSILAIILALVVLIIAIAVVYLVVRYFFPAQPPQYPAQTPLPVTSRQTQEALINNYGWVSKPTGAARIPVDRAMEIIASQGVPTLVEVPGQVTPQPTVSGAGGPGAALFQSLGCVGCHQAQNGIAPTLHGVYGSQVQLSTGQTVTADDAYIRESILDPTAKIVKGFNPIMPSFQGKVTDQQITQLIDYIKTLK